MFGIISSLPLLLCSRGAGGNFGRCLLSLHSRTMPKTEPGILNNPTRNVTFHLYFTYVSLVRPIFISTTSCHVNSSRSIHFKTCVCWQEIRVQTTSRYRYILRHDTNQYLEPFNFVTFLLNLTVRNRTI